MRYYKSLWLMLNPKLKTSVCKLLFCLNLMPTFLGSIEEGSVFGGVANLNDLGTSQQLHDEA